MGEYSQESKEGLTVKEVLIVDDEPLARQELDFLLKDIEPEVNTHLVGSIKEAQAVLLQEAIEVVFLDMQLHQENGLELMEQLQKVPQPPLVVFATAYEDYALQAFEMGAVITC